jgi:mono/diheme cytochrome c family protein
MGARLSRKPIFCQSERSEESALKKSYAGAGLIAVGIILVFIVVSFLRENWAADGTPGGIERWFAKLLLSQSRAGDELKNPLPADESTLSDGRAIYDQHCAFCHGKDGNGAGADGMQFYPPVPSLQNSSEPLSDGQVFSIVKMGIRYTAMPAFSKAFSEEEIWKVTSFVQTLRQPAGKSP